jgi:hypothetical protein
MTPDIRKSLISKAHSRTLTPDEAIMMARELEIWIDMALRAERAIHQMTKQREKEYAESVH